jgi:hypothetical protein
MCSTDFMVQALFYMASSEQVLEWALVVMFAYMGPVSTHLHYAGVLGVPHWWFHQAVSVVQVGVAGCHMGVTFGPFGGKG